MSVVAIGAALLGAGGSIGGAAIGASGEQSAASSAARRARSSAGTVTSEVNPLSNPIIAALVSNQLASLGIVDPSMLQSAGPLGRVLEQARAAGITGQEQFGIFASLTDVINSAGLDPAQPDSWLAALEQASTSQGQHFSLQQLDQFIPSQFKVGDVRENLAALLQADHAFQQQMTPIIQNLERIRETGLERTGLVNEALLGLTQDVAAGSDLGAIREAEMVRLQREIADRREQALQRANLGGFNPGGDLEDLSELETDADLVALERALGLVGGQQQTQRNSLALLLGLNPASPIENTASLLPSIGSAQQLAPGPVPAGAGALGNAISNTGSSIALLGLDSLLNRNGDTGSTSPGT